MKWVHSIWPLVCVVLLGCSADGGPVGTGISSTTSSISGNVIDVQSGSSAGTTVGSTVPTVHVSIDQVSGVQTTTDAGGNFQLNGNFSGSLTLRFALPDFQVTQAVDVPSNSAVVLQDIELAPDGVQEQAARQLNFVGRVALADCADGTLLVNDLTHMDVQFMVRLNDATSIVRGDNDSLDCDQINQGDTVSVEGAIQLQSDRTITALTVTLGAAPPQGPPKVERGVPFAGMVAALDCVDQSVVIDDTMQRSRLHLSTATVIQGPNGTVLACADLQLGDRVTGQGRLNLAMPGTIDATQLTVTAAPPTGQLRFFGFVNAIDCGSGVMQLTDISSAVQIHLLATTMITRNDGNQPAQCADVHPGDRVVGAGIISRTLPDGIDAIVVIFTRRDGPGGAMHGDRG